MGCEFFCSGTPASVARPVVDVSLSRWVNEPFPPWRDLLTARDVSRLTRRSKWAVYGLVLVGRFPRKRRFRGRAVGWLRSDVHEWLARRPGALCPQLKPPQARCRRAESIRRQLAIKFP